MTARRTGRPGARDSGRPPTEGVAGTEWSSDEAAGIAGRRGAAPARRRLHIEHIWLRRAADDRPDHTAAGVAQLVGRGPDVVARTLLVPTGKPDEPGPGAALRPPQRVPRCRRDVRRQPGLGARYGRLHREVRPLHGDRALRRQRPAV